MSTGRASAARRGYDTRWQRARASFLRAHPWCEYCGARGQRIPATVVDHRTPHRGDIRLFWDAANWRPLCKRCHDTAKQREERRGRPIGCDEQGVPLDPRHHWRM